MNAVGLIIISLGLILIVIGVKGSQHSVINTLKGVSTSSKAAQIGSTSTPPGGAAQTGGIFPTPTGQAPFGQNPATSLLHP